MMRTKRSVALLLLILMAGCTLSGRAGPEELPFAGQNLVIASTTSTQDSGLFDQLNPAFEQRTGATVTVVAKGTGAAIQFAMDKNADLIFVHAPKAEEKFIADGYGVKRYDVMYNDFVIVGPPDDPAGVRGMTDAAAAFQKIKEAGEAGNVVFISRGDNSGTNKKEIAVWGKAGVTPAGQWYILSGRGMGDTLVLANEEKGYTLSDRGTWLKMRDNLDALQVLVQGPTRGGDELLMNPYGIIAVNPEYNPEANYDLAVEYIRFVTGPEGQRIIGDYRRNGERLFIPDARETP